MVIGEIAERKKSEQKSNKGGNEGEEGGGEVERVVVARIWKEINGVDFELYRSSVVLLREHFCEEE